MLRLFIPLLVGLIFFASCEQKSVSNEQLSIIPKPDVVSVNQGSFRIDDGTTLLVKGISYERQVLIQAYIQEAIQINLPFEKKGAEKAIQFEIDPDQKEGYQLSVSRSGVSIKADTEIMLMYGMQSLRQLLYMHGQELPFVEIQDNASFQWRGMLLDCSRHFMEKEFVKRYIDLLALYKMNVLHWHLTEDQGWRIEIDKYPKLTEIGAWRDDGNGGKYGGFYTKEDIREIVAYATVRGVEVVPEIELPGHSQAALAAYPQFSCTGGPFEVETEWGVFKEIYCAGNDSTFFFLEDVLTEVMEMFPSKYIHIGGDEVPKYRWEHCEKCQKRIAIEGLFDEHELQSYFIKRVSNFLKSNGKQLIGWDEILEGGLPENAIVQSWRGFEGAKEAVGLGHQAIVSPTSHAYFDYGLNDIDMERVYDFNPIPEGAKEKERQLILGGECNMWSERAPQEKVDSKVFPRILAMAEVLWSGAEGKDYEGFRERVAKHYKMLDQLGVTYGFETVPVKITTETRDSKLFALLDSYDDGISIFYDQAGSRNQYEGAIQIDEPSNWSITFERNGTVYNDTILQQFEPHLANGLPLQIEHSYNDNYTAGGDMGLTDGKKGSTHFRDGNWQGYWGHDVNLIVDLGVEREINQLSSGFLQYNNAWIFFPENVTYSVSQDGSEYERVGVKSTAINPKDKEQQTQEFTVTLDQSKSARFVKMEAKNLGVCPEWHDAAGSKAWLFVDEFSIK